MKRIFTLLTLCLCAFISHGQWQQSAGFQKTLSGLSEDHDPIMTRAKNRGNLVRFQEDFANGFDGNNGIGAWTIESSGVSNQIWRIATEGDTGGINDFIVDTLKSSTASNGWAIFDIMLQNPEGLNDVTGSLTTPVIDMSTMSSVIVEWQQYFAYCCFATSPLSMEVTTDGGLTWTYWPAHGSFLQKANAASFNALLTSIDISCVAAGQPEVQIRWSYNIAGNAGYVAYWWDIDDIIVYENSYTYDVSVLKVNNADHSKTMKYAVTPMEQVPSAEDGGLVAATVYKNTGTATIDSAQVLVEVLSLDGETSYYAELSDYFTILSNTEAPTCPLKASDTLVVYTGWVPDEIGTYLLRTTLTATVPFENEETLNVAERIIEYSVGEYGHDRINDESPVSEMEPERVLDTDPQRYYPAGYGAFYEVPYNVSLAFGLSVRFGPDADAGTEFDVRLYELAPGQNINTADVVSSTAYILNQEWIPGRDEQGVLDLSTSEAIQFCFDEPYVLTTGMVYFVCVVNDLQSEGMLTVLANPRVDTDGSSAVVARTGSLNSVWFPDINHPAVRLLVGNCVVSVSEEEALVNKAVVQFMPNPASDMAQVQLELLKASKVAVEVSDLTGRVVFTQDFGNMQRGVHQHQLDVSSWPNGVYFYNVVLNGVRQSQKILVQH